MSCVDAGRRYALVYPCSGTLAEVMFGALAKTSSLVAGEVHSCALADGKVYCWGSGGQGEQATGSTPNAVLRPSTPMTDTWTP